MAVPPLVVVVMVASDPGDWFDESLLSATESDYPNLSLLVVDNGSKVPLAPRVASVSPSVFLIRNDLNLGFAEAVNEAVKSVQSATYLMICHDDVAFNPDAISVMVEDALRMNASIVAPKLVAWAYPDRVTSLGFEVDRTAALRSRVDVGDLDQDQFPIVEEVFSASAAAMLVRFDLFKALGGLNSEMYLFGEDIEFCYRAQQAGARVVAASYATVRHIGVLVSGPESDDVNPSYDSVRGRLSRADRTYFVRSNQMRCVLTNSSGLTRQVSRAQLWIIALIEASYFASTGRLKTSKAILGALIDGSKKTQEMLARRSVGVQSRILDQRELAKKFARGSARLSAFFAHQRNTKAQIRYEVERSRRLDRGALVEKKFIDEDEVDPTSLATRYVQRRLARGLQVVVVLYLLFSGRHVLFGSIPTFGQFSIFPRGSSLLSDFFSGSLSPSIPTPTSIPAGYLWLGVLGVAFFSATSLFYHLFILFLVATGSFGAYRLGARYKNPLSSTLAMVSYIIAGSLVGSFSSGSLFGVVTFAFGPWVLGITLDFTERMARGFNFDTRAFFRAAFVTALATSIAPGFIVLFLIMSVGHVVAFAFTRKDNWAGLSKLLRFLGGAGGIALLLNMTWFIGYLSSRPTAASLFGGNGPPDLGLEQLFSFGISRSGTTNSMAIALFVVLIFAPLFSKGVRHSRAELSLVSATVVTIIMVAYNSGGLSSDPLPLSYFSPLLAGYIAFSSATAVDAMYRDLARERFGYRQVAAGILILGIVFTSLGVGAPFASGRFGMPATGYEQSLGWVNTGVKTPTKVLWIGDPQSIPAGVWWFASGIGLAVTTNRTISFENIYTPIHLGTYEKIFSGLERAANLETTHLGAFMATSGVGNLIYPQSGVNPAVAKVTLALSRQVDLGQVLTDPNVTGYKVQGRHISTWPSPSSGQLFWPLALGVLDMIAWLLLIDAVFFGAYVSSGIATRVHISFSTERDQRRATLDTVRTHTDSASNLKIKAGN